MNKKGSHVDWAISIGLFLVYIIGMFILLRPGVTPAHKPADLLQILEDKVREEIMWEVKEVPIVLTGICSAGYDECNPTQAVEHPMIVIDVEGNWSLSDKIEPDDKAKWKDGTLTDLENSKEIPKGSYFMKLSPKSKDAGEPEISISYTRPCQCKENTNLGASTFKIGIKSFTSLISKFGDEESYKQVKNQWGFPKENEFQILRNGDPLTEFMEENAPYAQANVFSKQIKSWNLNSDGEFESPVEIVIRVW